MNKVILMGRLTADPVLRQTQISKLAKEKLILSVAQHGLRLLNS